MCEHYNIEPDEAEGKLYCIDCGNAVCPECDSAETTLLDPDDQQSPRFCCNECGRYFD